MTWHLDNIPQLRSHSHSPSGQRAPLYQVRVPQGRKSLIHAALPTTRHWPPCESSNRSNALALDWICARTQVCTQCGTQLETAVRTSPQSLWSRTIWGRGKSNVSPAQSKFRIAGPAPSYEHTNALLLCVAVLCCCACALFPGRGVLLNPSAGSQVRTGAGVRHAPVIACPTPPILEARVGIAAHPQCLLTTRPDLKRKRALVLLNARRDQLAAAALQESSPQQMRCSQVLFRRTCRIRLTGGCKPANLVPKGNTSGSLTAVCVERNDAGRRRRWYDVIGSLISAYRLSVSSSLTSH